MTLPLLDDTEQLHSPGLRTYLEMRMNIEFRVLLLTLYEGMVVCFISNSSFTDTFVKYSKNELLNKSCAWVLTMSNSKIQVCKCLLSISVPISLWSQTFVLDGC